MPDSSAATLITKIGASWSPRSTVIRVRRADPVGRRCVESAMARAPPRPGHQLGPRVVPGERLAVGLDRGLRGAVERLRELDVDRDEQVGLGAVATRGALALDP